MSRTGDLKSEIVNRAYDDLRISGLTRIPTSFDNTKALDTLENMMEEYKDRGICLDYNYEDEPDLNSLHGIKRKYWDSVSLCLARRLLNAFGKGFSDKVDPQLLSRQRVAFEGE